MRTLVHLSDLHFGRTDAGVLAPLSDLVQRLGPDLVVVSGDLTQRARSEQFQEARDFLDTLPSPQVIVPGNHDISLYNVVRRFAAPLQRYQRYITHELEPSFIDNEIAVLGMNTARSLTFKAGRVDPGQIGRMHARFSQLDPQVTRIVVSHHPLDLPPALARGQRVGRAGLAMRSFADCGVDLLLAGHMHASHAGSTPGRHVLPDYAALVVQAGTATSTRARGEVNSFNVVRIDGGQIEVARYGWNGLGTRFELLSTKHFERHGNRWSVRLHNQR